MKVGDIYKFTNTDIVYFSKIEGDYVYYTYLKAYYSDLINETFRAHKGIFDPERFLKSKVAIELYK